MNPSGDEVKSRSEWMASLCIRGLSNRSAIVIGEKSHQLGLARMAQTYLAFRRMDLQIFTGLDDAIRWLSSPVASGTAGQ